MSDSTGTDGAFNPASSTQITLPPSGIFNFTDVTIPAGVTITFTRNDDNTPVRILATGDVIIEGIININGGNGGNGGDFNNSAVGVGGPGGYDGGKGGLPWRTAQAQAGDGLGPGRGTGAPNGNGVHGANGAGASFGSLGDNGTVINGQGVTGPIYGNAELLPLIGGSGGGGSAGATNTSGSGGGGGAILIAATGTVIVNGAILANGGVAGISPTYNASGNQYPEGQAGNGSGGAIRIIATIITGEGTITAYRNTNSIHAYPKKGGDGRIRLETENLLRTTNTIPTFSYSPNPGVQLIPNIPSIRISAVAGTAAPANPTGSGDVVLPGVTPNPVTVDFQTSNIPAGTVLTLIAAPERGTAVTASSSAIAANGSASASINMPNGNSRLTAQTTFNVTASLGKDFSMYAKGEQVEKVRVGINAEGLSETTFITINGKEFTVPSNTVAMN